MHTTTTDTNNTASLYVQLLAPPHHHQQLGFSAGQSEFSGTAPRCTTDGPVQTFIQRETWGTMKL